MAAECGQLDLTYTRLPCLQRAAAELPRRNIGCPHPTSSANGLQHPAGS